MGFANRAIVAGGLGFAISALVGCGGSGGLLSLNQASRLNDQLAAAGQYLSSGECRDAAQAIRSFQDSVGSLSSVNQTLVSNLSQGATTIQTLANQECPVRSTHPTKPKKPKPKPAKTTTSTTTTATQTTTITTPAQTTTTSTQTTTTPTTTTQTTTSPTTTTTTTPNTGGTGFGGSTTTTGTVTTP